MVHESKPHRGLLDIIGEKESELSTIRHVTERAIEEEEQKAHQQHLQLRSDFEHNINLLFQKDEIILSLQSQLMERKDQYEISLKYLEEQNEKIVEKKIGQIRHSLEEEWNMCASRVEEEQRRRLEVEYKEKILRRQQKFYAENQDSILSELKNQEKDLRINFDKITKEKQLLHEELEKGLRKELIKKERENASIISTFEHKWSERESSLGKRIAAESELKIHGVRQEAERVQKQSKTKIAELLGEQEQLITKIACCNNEIQELHEINSHLNRKIQDLLGVIESAERGFEARTQDLLKAEAITQKKDQTNKDHITSLEIELNKKILHYEDYTTQLKKRWSDKKVKFHHDITQLKKERKDLRVEKKRIHASVKNAEYLRMQLENEIESHNNQCSELKGNLKCVQERLNCQNESMSVLLRENSDLKNCMSKTTNNVQQKETIIEQFKNQILEDKRSFGEKWHQVAKERDTILNDKEVRIKKIVALKSELESMEQKLFQTIEESRNVKSRELSELTYSLQQSRLENDRLKATVTLMRQEMELVTVSQQQVPKQSLAQSCFIIRSDIKMKIQLQELRSQLDRILNEGKPTTNTDDHGTSEHDIEDISIPDNCSKELNSIVECLRNEIQQDHMHMSQTCEHIPDREKNTSPQLSELSNELNVVILERNNLLELSNKLRSDLHKLNDSIPALGSQTMVESVQAVTNLSNSIVTRSSSDEVDSDSLAKSIWTSVLSPGNTNKEIVNKLPVRASDRATASQRMLALKSRKKCLKPGVEYTNQNKGIKVRNWSYKDD